MTDATAMNGVNNALDVMALGASPTPGARGGRGASGAGGAGASWFEALATAWGQTLDGEAQKLESMSDNLGTGSDQPSQIAELSAESMRMSFLSQSEQSSVSAAGDSLQTMARKE